MKKSLCFAVVGFVVFVCCSATARVLVYEPFDYPDAALNGQGGALGTTGTWTTNDTDFAEGWWCHPEGELTGQFDDIGGGLNMFDGTVDNLPTSGGFVGSAGPEEQGSASGTRDPTGNMDANIGLDPSVTATFQSGTTTWFSYVGAHADNRNQGSPTFMLCTDPTDNGARGVSMQNSGNGIGGVGGPPRFNLHDVYPHYFSGGIHHQTPGGYQDGVFGAHDGIVTAFASTSTANGVLDESGQPRTQTMAWQISDDNGFGAANIVVGKIEWDADTGGEDIISVVRFLETDELSEAAFDALVAALPPLSRHNWASNKPNLDQSQFDTLNISSLKFYVDEIRLATTFGEVIGVPSNAASTPNPADEATDVPRDVSLSWTPSEFAAPTNGHKVYFGESFNDVNDATGGMAQTDTTYAPGILTFGQTHYWRVDEIDNTNTVYPGEVWSFTVEPFAYPIDGNNITATASSSDSGTTGPENTINASGLDANDLHSTEKTDMWLSSNEPLGASIQYEFDKVYKVHEMWVWNSNTEFESALGFGLKDVTIEYSTNGTDWTALGVVPEFAQAPGSADYAHNAPVDFGGVSAKYVNITANSNWGSLTQYGLSEVRFLYIPVWAREPNPDSGAAGVDVDNVTLGWRAGREAAEHNVYLGTDERAVADGTVPPLTVAEASYDTGTLDLGEIYYWKVNEVNMAETATSWEGDIWNFTTLEYLVVDDFEDYDTADNQIWFVWKDGIGYSDPAYPPSYPGNNTGSAVGDENTSNYMEQTIFYGGRCSMPLAYDNSGAGGKLRYSETFREWSVPQNWTANGVKALVVPFYGDPANTPAPLYVAVEDSMGNIKDVAYNNGDQDAVLVGDWQEFQIQLTDFTGVNLAAVKKMYIGLGNRASPTAGGTGTIYIDDIGLYPSRCVLSERSADFARVDYVEDCVVDCKELQIITNQWLTAGHLVTPVDPGTAGLQAQYQFEGNTNDSSGKGRNGTAMGGPLFIAGKVGQAISLDGTDDYVTIAGYKGVLADASGVQQPFTITAWVKTTDSGDRTIASWGTNSAMQRVDFRLFEGRLRVEHGGGNVQGDTTLNDDNWHHVALTMIQGATVSYPDVQLWLDGKDNTRASTDPDAFSITAGVDMAIGYLATAAGRYFLGAIDDVRLYDRALSQAEVAWLAGITAPFSEPFDLNVDGAVNFKDFAELAVWWLDEQLWP